MTSVRKLEERRRRMARDSALAAAAPYTVLADPTVVRTRHNHYLQVFRMAGRPFETTEDQLLNEWHERLNLLWRTIADPTIAIWCHLVRTAARVPPYDFHSLRPGGYAEELKTRYSGRLAAQTLRENTWYLSVLYRPTTPNTTPNPRRAPKGNTANPHLPESSEPLATCARIAEQIQTGLCRYDLTPLGQRATPDGIRSDLLSFLHQILNAEEISLAPPLENLATALATARVVFGADTVEYRHVATRRFGAFLAIKEYPSPTSPGMLNALLAAPFTFLMTQSFTFLPKSAAQGLLARQYNRMTSSGDLAASQASALRVAMDQLASNQYVIGDHHLSLQVLSDPEPLRIEPERSLARLDESLAKARVMLGDAGVISAREDLALESAFRAQLPGNFSDRPRRAPITSRNFAGFASFHNYPEGRPVGNHWGDALAVLKTASGGPYYFSLHATDPQEPADAARDVGHTFICGPSGSGKTVLVGFCIANLVHQAVSQVILDKDHGLELLVAALGGEYRTLEAGCPTGLNPLRLPVSQENLAFLRLWLAALVSTPLGIPTTVELQTLERALAGTLALPDPCRTLSRLLEFIDPTEPGGMHERLGRWCHSRDGSQAWVFDNEEDRVLPLLRGHTLIGFDVTAFLRNPEVRGPVATYLFHLIRSTIDGRRLVVWMDEFSTLLDHEAFTAFSKDGLKTWRKLNAVAAFATQSPSDVLQSAIARTLIEQTPTKIFFPNPDADRDEYTRGLGLTEREYELVRRTLSPTSRRFLLKQSQSSVVCELDLRGMDFDLTVISGRAKSLKRMRSLRESVGETADQWLHLLIPPEAEP